MNRSMMILAMILLLGTQRGWAGDSLRVQVRTTQVRSGPSFLGRVVTPLSYGDVVTPTRQQGVWTQVRTADGTSGWVHESALGKRKVTMQAGDEDVDTVASGDELALAGKGFSSDVEAAFKKANRHIDFTWVDRMEKMTVPVAKSTAFLRAGLVKPREGGSK